MTKNDPVASDQTLPYTPPPSNRNLERVRLGLDRVRLWVRGVTDVKLADQDLIALELAAQWMRENRMLTPAEVTMVSNALSIAIAIIEEPYGGPLQRENLHRVKRARDLMAGEK